MDRFNALGRGAQVMLVAGVLLLIDTFLRWQEVEFDLGPIGGGSVGQSAWNGFWGVVLGLLTVALVAWLVARLVGVSVPLPFSPALIGAALAVLIFVFALIKNLDDDYSTFWAWVGLALSIALLLGAWLEVQASGGLATLKSELPSMPAATAPVAEGPATPAPPPAAPATPGEPAPPAEPQGPSTSEHEGEAPSSGAEEPGERPA
jgi:hypothetical protein